MDSALGALIKLISTISNLSLHYLIFLLFPIARVRSETGYYVVILMSLAHSFFTV